MKNNNSRDDFSSATKAALAKRAQFLCSICRAQTISAGMGSSFAVMNIGIAAHITAASPGGVRYDESMTPAARSGIDNGIWLCPTDASRIDRDPVKWAADLLRKIKREHEKYVEDNLGESQVSHTEHINNIIVPQEYAFLRVSEIKMDSYKAIISPILHDKGLGEDAELGLLMCGTSDENHKSKGDEVSWTIFVNADWLRWCLTAQSNGYKIPTKVPTQLVYGKIPALPDTFLEFLYAIVLTNSTFMWHRHPDGYLALAQ